MRRLLKLAAGVAVALTAVATAQPAQARVDEPSGWRTVSSYGYVYESWTLNGEVDGRPGNAHSGTFSVSTEQDVDMVHGLRFAVSDWTCPEGAQIPHSTDRLDPYRKCQFEAVVEMRVDNPGAAVKFGKYLVNNRTELTAPLSDSLDGTVVDTHINVMMRGLNPAYRTVEFDRFKAHNGDRYAGRTIDRSRPVSLSGDLAWVDFADPRMRVRDEIFWHDQYDLKKLDGPS